MQMQMNQTKKILGIGRYYFYPIESTCICTLIVSLINQLSFTLFSLICSLFFYFILCLKFSCVAKNMGLAVVKDQKKKYRLANKRSMFFFTGFIHSIFNFSFSFSFSSFSFSFLKVLQRPHFRMSFTTTQLKPKNIRITKYKLVVASNSVKSCVVWSCKARRFIQIAF